MTTTAIHHPDGIKPRGTVLARCPFSFTLPSGKRGFCEAVATWEIISSVFGIPKHDWFCDFHKGGTT